MRTLKPWITAIILSLLIHGGLLAVIAVKYLPHRQTDAEPLTIGTGSSRVRFLVSDGENGNGGTFGHSTDNEQAPLQVEQVKPPPASVPETPLPVSDAPIRSLMVDVAANLQPVASVDLPGVTTDGVAGSGGGIGHGDSGSTGGGTAGNGSAAAYARNPLPPYPREARERRWQGTTLLRVEVLGDGAAGKIGVAESSGHPILDEASVQTVRDWKFLPARSGDTPIPSIVEIPITFRLVE